MIPQTLNYADGGIRVAGLPDQAHPPRGTTARMADFARIEAQTRPMTTKTVSLMETRKLDVSVDPQNAPPPPPGAPAIAALGTMNLGTGSAVPAWVAFDGQTLNFEAFFVQPAVDGRDRVRRCVLRFYLEDGTADVCEPKTDNSGLAQGRLLKRHKAVNGATGAPLTYRDFVVGGSLKLYGVDYAVVACDAFTREFLTREGIDVAPDSTTPPALIDEGPGVLGTIGMGVRGVGGRKVYDPSEFPPPAADADDAVGDERDPRTDAFDRRVLRFFCSWKDGSERDSESETCHYTLNYFLRDGTVEVLEDSGPHAQGRDPFPKMLARSRLPAGGAFDVRAPAAPGKRQFLNADDIRVGATVGVYGRDLVVHDCDESTRAFYVKECGRTLAEMAPRPGPAPAPRPKMPVPPHDGFGSEEDSRRNCESLVPRRAPFDFRNFERTEGKVLVFTAQFEGENVTPPDDERRFVVSYYLVDGSVAVYEPPVVNSGFIGGKFLERTMAPVKKPGSRAPYVAKDFKVGAVIELSCRRFQLLATDAATEKIIKEHVAAAKA